MTLKEQYASMEELLTSAQDSVKDHFERYVFSSHRPPTTEQLMRLDQAIKEDPYVRAITQQMVRLLGMMPRTLIIRNPTRTTLC